MRIQKTTLAGAGSSRVFVHLLAALAGALLCAAIEIAAYFLKNLLSVPSFSVGGEDPWPSLTSAALLSLPSRAPLLLLIPLLCGLVIFLYARLSRRSLALRAYARALRSARLSSTASSPLLADSGTVYETTLAYYQDITDRSNLPHKQDLSLSDLPQERLTQLLLLGAPGSGKTLALALLQEAALRLFLSRGNKGGKLPVYVPLEHYSLYLNRRSSIDFVASAAELPATQEEAVLTVQPEATLFDFLYESDLPGMRYLRPYLLKLAERGDLLFLCDDFHLVDAALRDTVAAELVYLMSQTPNVVVLTSCDLAREALPQLERLLEEGQMDCALIMPLQPLQIRRVVERALREQHTAVKQAYTAGQIMRAIESSRLRYICSLPLTLFVLLEVLDGLDVEDPAAFDTRGRLFERLVSQVIAHELQQRRWQRLKDVPVEEEVLTCLRWLACALYWTGARSTVPLKLARRRRGAITPRDLAAPLRNWLAENRPRGPINGLAEDEPPAALTNLQKLERILECAQGAGLLVCDGDGLHFRHLWLAEYLVAASFRAAEEGLDEEDMGEAQAPLLSEFCADVVRWSGPLAMWAGLLDDPLALAERCIALGEAQPSCAVSACALALICVGVAWHPPLPGDEKPLSLSARMVRVLSGLLRDPQAVESLAHVIMRCAAEGTLEVYQGLIPTLVLPGADALLRRCEEKPLLDRLFDYLCDAIDLPGYDAQVRRLIPVLGRFGEAVIARAADLTRAQPGRSLRLRAAAIRILARTEVAAAVPPLLDCLGDGEQVIIEGALKALIRLGPARVLKALLQELEQYIPGVTTPRQVQRAILVALDYFLNDPDPERLLSDEERQQVIETISPLLASYHPQEVQRLAREVLSRQVSQRPHKELIALLIRGLAGSDEVLVRNVIRVLQQGDSRITPYLLEELEQQTSEVVRMHLVEVLGGLRDLQALPPLLKLLADPAPMVRQQVGIALQHAYVPESIPGLIELVLHSPDEQVATRATRILRDMGEEVIEPILGALPQVVPGRTQLLVQVLEDVHDTRIIPALISLLRDSHRDALLTVAVIRSLSRFADPQVSLPLIELLASKETLIYEAAISALTQLRESVLSDLLAALDVEPEQESVVAARVRRAILGMEPFPGEQLIAALQHGTEAQARQLREIFLERGADAALLLVNHLFHPDLRVRAYVRQTLEALPGQILVPALLEVLNRPTWRQVLAEYLLRYPAEAIPPLIALLADPERGDAAVAIVLRFGPDILPAVVPGLDHSDELARRRAQQIVTALARQQPEVLEQIVRLFGPALPPRAHESLVELLAGDLADLAVPALLAGLGDAYLLAGVSEVLSRLARRRMAPAGREALKGLVEALRSDERRHGAEITLAELGELVVTPVGELITDPDPQVARSAQRILRDIGTPALPFIWAACSDIGNRPRREAALDIFRSMPTMVIKGELLAHLASENIQESSMAATLLRERIHDEESSADPSRQEMVPALLEYIQTPQSDEGLCRRVIALLLLIGGTPVVDHLVQALYERPLKQELLMRSFLFLGREGEEALWGMYHDPETPPELANRVVSTLGMLNAYPEICELALSLGHYGLTLHKDSLQSPDQLAISLRALGGLLAGGHWDVQTLQELRRKSKEGSMERDLLDVLLGWRYGAYITRLENDLQSIEQAHKEDVRNLTMQLLQARSQLSDLEHEHETLETTLKRTQDELNIVRQDLTRASQELNRLQQEHGSRSDELDQAQQTIQRLQDRLNLALQEKRILQDQIYQLHAHNAQLVEQLNLLQGAENP